MPANNVTRGNVSASVWYNVWVTIQVTWRVLTTVDFWRYTVRDVLRGLTGPMVVHYSVPWVDRRITAICLGRHVFTHHAILRQWVLDHEERHVQHYQEHGFFGYLVRWFHQNWTVGYIQNRFEREADAQANTRQAERFAHYREVGRQARKGWGGQPEVARIGLPGTRGNSRRRARTGQPAVPTRTIAVLLVTQ